MFGSRYAHEVAAKAEAALASSVKQQIEQATLAAQLQSHLTDCSRKWDDFKEENIRWQACLGARLDRQDRYMIAALVSIIGILLSVAGYLITSSGILHG